jgi:hypothetical protein
VRLVVERTHDRQYMAECGEQPVAYARQRECRIAFDEPEDAGCFSRANRHPSPAATDTFSAYRVADEGNGRDE